MQDTILIVDDENSVLQALTRLRKEHFLNTDMAAKGLVALRNIAEAEGGHGGCG